MLAHQALPWTTPNTMERPPTVNNWTYEADLGIDHDGGRQAAGNLGPYLNEADVRAAVATVLGTSLAAVRAHPQFGEYPEGTEDVAADTPIMGATLTRYTSDGTDDDWRVDVN